MQNYKETEKELLHLFRFVFHIFPFRMFLATLRAECAGFLSQIVLNEAREVALRREIEHIGDVGQREALVLQQMHEFDGCVAVDPRVGREAAHLLANL